MNKRLLFTAYSLVGLMGLMACSDNKSAPTEETIEAIQAKQGIPVRVQPLKIQEIAEYRRYSGTVKGTDQTMVKIVNAERIVKLHARIGDRVRKDQLLAELETQDMNNPMYRQAQAGYELATKSFERIKQVFAEGGISQQQLDEAETQLKLAQANYDAIRKTTRLLAPADGVITDLFYEEGQTPQADTYLYSLGKLDRVEIEVAIPPQEIHLFKKGLPAQVDASGKLSVGNVTQVPLAASPVTRFFPVTVAFKNPERKLLPGMYVEIAIQTRATETVCIPNDGMVYQDGKYYAYKLNGDKVAKVEVQTGIVGDGITEVLDGLNPDDVVVIEGLSKLRDGLKIKVVE